MKDGVSREISVLTEMSADATDPDSDIIAVAPAPGGSEDTAATAASSETSLLTSIFGATYDTIPDSNSSTDAQIQAEITKYASEPVCPMDKQPLSW